MTELELKQLLSRITRPDETARTAAHAHWASLAKPLGGLGRLETMLEDAAALTGADFTAELPALREAFDKVNLTQDQLENLANTDDNAVTTYLQNMQDFAAQLTKATTLLQ